MNLKNITADALDDLDLHLPEEAIAALQAGEEWEYEPDSVEGADATAYYCDDCDTWHQVWTAWGLRLDVNGTLFEVEWTVDTDGDWQVSDEYPYGTFDHAKAYEEARQLWVEYARWVVRHKQDPLNNFGWSARPDRKERVWTVDFAPSVVSPVVRRAREGKKKFIPVSEFPAHLRDFLCSDERGMMKDFASWDDFKARAMNLVWVSDTRATLTIGETVYPTSARKVGFVKAARQFIYNNKQEVK